MSDKEKKKEEKKGLFEAFAVAASNKEKTKERIVQTSEKQKPKFLKHVENRQKRLDEIEAEREKKGYKITVEIPSIKRKEEEEI